MSDKTCPNCGVKPGQRHASGCDVAKCPRCGLQLLGCDCIYLISNIEPATLDITHPDVYNNGPTDAMIFRWEMEWGHREQPWTGEWPGVAECREYGWYAYLVPGRGWVPCPADHPEAMPDLNRLIMEGRWDADKGRWLRREAS